MHLCLLHEMLCLERYLGAYLHILVRERYFFFFLIVVAKLTALLLQRDPRLNLSWREEHRMGSRGGGWSG